MLFLFVQSVGRLERGSSMAPGPQARRFFSGSTLLAVNARSSGWMPAAKLFAVLYLCSVDQNEFKVLNIFRRMVQNVSTIEIKVGLS